MARNTGARRKQRQGAPDDRRGRQALQTALAAFQHGRPDQTAAICAEILQNKPHEPNALHLLGVAYLGLGQVADAAETLFKATSADPRNAEIHANLGAALRAGGMAEAAEASLRRAIEVKPDHLQAHFNLGNTLCDSDRFAEAEACYRTVLSLSPGHAGAHNNLGTALEANGDMAAATACFEAAAAADPGYRDAHRNIARVCRDQGRLTEAVDHYQAAIDSMPGDIASMNDQGVVLFELENIDEAVSVLNKVVEISADCVDAHINLGNMLCAIDRPDDAVVQFERALAGDPGCVDAVVNMGHARKQQGDMSAAIETYRQALATDPDHHEAWFGKGFCHLLLGEFEDGWRGYRRRESMRGADDDFRRDAVADTLERQRILVVRDQGIGDEIFFLRFLPALARRGAHLSYLPDARLADMFKRAGVAEIVTDDDVDARGFDLKLSVGDLPLVLGPDPVGDTPPSIRLEPLPERTARLRRVLAAFGPPPYIGVTWRAGTRGRHSLLYKESPASRMAAALAPLDARIIAMQRAPRDGEVAGFCDALGRQVCDLTGLNDDLEDMLALVGLLDDYVCVSNSNVHFAAARGRTCRLLIPNPPEFRWMAAGDESPWFPGMKVYRQGTGGDWSAAFDALARDLGTVFR